MRYVLHTVAAALTAFVSIASVAATKTTSPQRKTTAAKSEMPFDMAAAKLPPHFKGNTVEGVLQNHAIAPKGEFETTGEYKARLKEIDAKIYAFVVEDVDFEYNADRETYTASIQPSDTVTWDSRVGYRSFDIHSIPISDTTYPATNAFGVTVTVDKTVIKRTQVLTDEWPSSTIRANIDPVRLKLPMDRQRARELKNGLRVAFVCVPKPEQLKLQPQGDIGSVTGRQHSAPTIDDPSDFTWYFVALRVELLQLLIFDDVTGEILARYPPDGVRLSAPISPISAS